MRFGEAEEREQKQQSDTHTQQQLFLFILASPLTSSLRHEKSDRQPTSHKTRLSLLSLKLQKEGKARIERKMKSSHQYFVLSSARLLIPSLCGCVLSILSHI